MTREELLEYVSWIEGAFRFITDSDYDYGDWFFDDGHFDRWAEDRLRDMNWDDARSFLNELPPEYSSGYYIREDADDDGDWKFYEHGDTTPAWLIDRCVGYAEVDGLITYDEEDGCEIESNSNSGLDTLADPPKPEDTISFEDFDSLFEEVAS